MATNKYLDEDGLRHFWGNIKSAIQASVVSKSSTTPAMDGSASTGSESAYAAGDHVHPTDTSRAPLASPAFTGTPTAPTASSGTNTTQIATTAFVQDAVSGIGGATTNEELGQGYATCSTAASTTAKEATLSGYELVKGGIVTVLFTYSVPANATLNINSKGAKSIYSDGAAIKANVIMAGNFATFMYDGTYYHLISVAGSSVPVQLSTAGQNLGYYTLYYSGGNSNYIPTYSYLENSFIKSSSKGAASGVCPLDSNGKVEASRLPSYVDDVIEAYAVGSTPLESDWLSLTASGTAFTPETGKIYILMADSGSYYANSQFRWGSTTYVKMNDGGVSAITNSEIDTICV